MNPEPASAATPPEQAPPNAAQQESIDDLQDVALDLACWACARIAGAEPTTVQVTEQPADPVTATGFDVHERVRGRIAERWPGHRVLGEEFDAAGPADAEYTWYCDPVDGTTNYANGIAWCAFSLACWDPTGPLVGVVGDPHRRRVAVGRRGGGATVRDLDTGHRPVPGSARALAVRGGSGLAGTVLTTEWLAHLRWPGMLGTLARLADAGCTVRIMGSSALSLLQVGLGAAAGCLIGQYSAINGSAAVLIAQEAGAVACGNDGAPAVAPEGGMLLAAPGYVEDLLAAWRGGSAPA